jgi:hypothetical protein
MTTTIRTGFWSAVIALAAAAFLLLATPRDSRAAIYWTDANAGTIGRASLDGSAVGRRFAVDPVTPWDVAAGSRHLYWTDINRGTISRSRLDGRGLVRDFVRIPDSWSPIARNLALSSSYLYWSQGNNFIGRSRIDGRKAQPRFLDTRSSAVWGVALTGRHIYWTSNDPAFDPPPRVGRSRIDGSGVDRQFIRSATGPGDMARYRGHIYWVNSNTNSISRARLDGSGLKRRFVRTGEGVVSSVAVAGGFIYWTDYIRRTIGRARIDGSGVRRSFIRVGGTRGGLRGIAVVPRRRAPDGGRG